jgi:hypothetical protein
VDTPASSCRDMYILCITLILAIIDAALSGIRNGHLRNFMIFVVHGTCNSSLGDAPLQGILHMHCIRRFICLSLALSSRPVMENVSTAGILPHYEH